MVSLQILKNSIEELHTITKVDLSVFDSTGNELVSFGEKPELDQNVLLGFINSPADSQIVGKNHLLKVFDDDEPVYILVASGTSEEVYMIGRVAVSQLKLIISAYKEKVDKNNFFQNLLMDNMLLVDVYSKAKKLRIDVNIPRVVYIVEAIGDKDTMVTELLKGMFSQQVGDYVTEVDENNIIIIKALSDKDTVEDIRKTAQSIVDMVNTEAMINVRVGIGTVASELKDVSKSYKEAMMAVDVGKIFYEERSVNAYSSLGIGRLIYQLPPNLCQLFLEEVFKNNDPSTFDEEIVSTVYKFFENNLNVSETSRQLFIHRNTLVYRVEKLKALTGLDVREFDDALTFIIAMMVYNYLRYLQKKEE